MSPSSLIIHIILWMVNIHTVIALVYISLFVLLPLHVAQALAGATSSRTPTAAVCTADSEPTSAATTTGAQPTISDPLPTSPAPTNPEATSDAPSDRRHVVGMVGAHTGPFGGLSWFEDDAACLAKLIDCPPSQSRWFCGSPLPSEGDTFMFSHPASDNILFKPPHFTRLVTPHALLYEFYEHVESTVGQLSSDDVLVLVLVGHGNSRDHSAQAFMLLGVIWRDWSKRLSAESFCSAPHAIPETGKVNGGPWSLHPKRLHGHSRRHVGSLAT